MNNITLKRGSVCSSVWKWLHSTTLFAFMIACMSAAIAYGQYNITSYGAIADDGQDDAPAIQAAINDLFGTGAGTVVFPKGKFQLNTPVNCIPPQNKYNSSVIFEGKEGSHLEVSVGDTNTAFYCGNLHSLTFRDMSITGKLIVPYNINHPQFFDARQLLYVAGTAFTNFENSVIAGFAVKNPNELIYATETDLKIEDTILGGNLARSPSGVLIRAFNSRGFTFRRSHIIDYHWLRGTYYSKSPGTTWSWIAVRYNNPPAHIRGRRVIIEDSRFDEAALRSAEISGAKYVSLKGNYVNVSGASGSIGFSLYNVGYVQADHNSFFKWNNSVSARPAFKFHNVGLAEVAGADFQDGVYFANVINSTVNTKACAEC